jgi:hypothetical protein
VRPRSERISSLYFKNNPVSIIFIKKTISAVGTIKKRTKADMSAITSDQVFIKPFGKRGTLVSAANPRKKSKSEHAKRTNNRFKGASHWAASILLEPGKKELYSKGINEDGNSAHAVARNDFLNPPKIHYTRIENYTGAIGDRVRIKATDSFPVMALTVSISRRDGQLLEKGDAVRDLRKPVMWTYQTTVANPELPGTIITVIAQDLPGNKSLHELTIANDGPDQAQVTRSEVMPVKYRFYDRKTRKFLEV